MNHPLWPKCELDESLFARVCGCEPWVDVWCFPLTAPDESPDKVQHLFETYLSTGERMRARAFYRESDQCAFIVAHAYKRLLLGAYLQIEPQALRFASTVIGKPFLVGRGLLSFNLSHSGHWGALALGSQDLGVDVESQARCQSSVEIAERFFAPTECAALMALPKVAQSAAFCQRWVAKEAILKAAGTGLVGGLSSFEVPALLSTSPVAVDWGDQMYQLAGQRLAPDDVVAVAWRGEAVLPKFMSFML